MDELHMMSEVLAAADVPGDLSGALVSRKGTFTMHVKWGCTFVGPSSGDLDGPRSVASLLDGLDPGVPFELCLDCLWPGPVDAPDVVAWMAAVRAIWALAWVCDLDLDPDTLRSPGQVGYEHLYSYARRLLIAADTFGADTFGDYERHRALKLDNVPLRSLHEQLWDERKAEYEDALAAQHVTTLLDTVRRDRVGGKLVACSKRRAFSGSEVYRLAVGDVLTLAALLEGPRMGGTSDYFVTVPTWAPADVPFGGLKVFTRPGVDTPPEVFAAALGLWDGRFGSVLADLVESVRHATA